MGPVQICIPYLGSGWENIIRDASNIRSSDMPYKEQASLVVSIGPSFELVYISQKKIQNMPVTSQGLANCINIRKGVYMVMLSKIIPYQLSSNKCFE